MVGQQAYGERHRAGEAISTAFTESAVNRVITKRMVKRQQMRWSPKPKNSNDSPTGAPLFFRPARSAMKPRKSARPVPQPIMIMGTCGLSGGRNGMFGLRTKAKIVLRAGFRLRYPEQTPVNSPSPDREGPRSTPTAMLQTAGEVPETARLSRVLAGSDLLHAAERAATSVFERICNVLNPPTS